MAGKAINDMFLLNIIAILTNTLPNGDVATKLVHRVFSFVHRKMLSNENHALLRVKDTLDTFKVVPYDDKIFRKIMQLCRHVAEGLPTDVMGTLPFITICVTVDHGEVTRVDGQFDPVAYITEIADVEDRKGENNKDETPKCVH